MLAIPPLDILAGYSTMLLSSSADEEAVYDPEAHYSIDDVVFYGSTVYKSLQDLNHNKLPTEHPDYWLDQGLINKLRMFDTSRLTLTSSTSGNLVVRFKPFTRITHIALLNLVGSSVRVQKYASAGGSLIFDETQQLSVSGGTYYSYVFSDVETVTKALFANMPGAHSEEVVVTITPLGGTASCGLLACGKPFNIGDAQWGFTTPIEFRGRTYIDNNQNLVTTERGYVIGCSGSVIADALAYNRTIDFFGKYAGLPLLWVLDSEGSDYTSSLIFGRYEKVVPAFEYHGEVTYNLDISGFR